MAIQKTEAFVLKTQPFRSSSLIVTFFTRSFGKIRAVVKGVRSEREMRGALFELFTRLEIVFYEKVRSDLHLLSEAFILESQDRLRTDLATISYASYLSELVDRVTEVHDPHEKIFDLLDFSFRFLGSLAPEDLVRLFEVKLLHEVGWLPYLEGCLACQDTKLEAGFFSIQQGALFCSRCARDQRDARPISREALAAIRHAVRHDLETGLKHRIGSGARKEIGTLLEQFLLYRLGGPLKSRGFLKSIRPVLAAG